MGKSIGTLRTDQCVFRIDKRENTLWTYIVSVAVRGEDSHEYVDQIYSNVIEDIPSACTKYAEQFGPVTYITYELW